jgi:hypothetical protein
VLISRFDIIASLPVVSLLQVRTSHGHSNELDHESLNPVIPALTMCSRCGIDDAARM